MRGGNRRASSEDDTVLYGDSREERLDTIATAEPLTGGDALVRDMQESPRLFQEGTTPAGHLGSVVEKSAERDALLDNQTDIINAKLQTQNDPSISDESRAQELAALDARSLENWSRSISLTVALRRPPLPLRRLARDGRWRPRVWTSHEKMDILAVFPVG